MVVIEVEVFVRAEDVKKYVTLSVTQQEKK